MSVSAQPLALEASEWLARARTHEARVRAWTDPHQARAARGERHPVYDFLFTYYSHRAAWLRRWQPGPGIVLRGPGNETWLARADYREAEQGGAVLGPLPASRRIFVAWLRDFLAATAARPAFLGCFALHEWAMVYRQAPEDIRHNQLRLRFPPDRLAEIVEQLGPRCTHFDAYRFFTPAARPLNRHLLTRETTPEHEQPGCLHANMDLYKWAGKLGAYIPAELVADCFALALDIRELDMRASPYDVSDLGFPPVPIETPEGRAEFERLQREFAARAVPLRARLIELCDTLLAESV